MAKVYTVPPQLNFPEIDYSASNLPAQLKEQQKAEQRLVEWCKKNGSGEHAGKIVRELVADGYARYVVLSLRPAEIVHIPSDYDTENADHWSAAEIKRKISQTPALPSRLFGGE